MTNDDEEILANLLLRWEELRERGQKVQADELCRDQPHLLEDLARRIKILNVTAWLDQPLSDEDRLTSALVVQPNLKLLIGRYRLDDLIAEGGFAQVWRGYDTELQRTVAVKIPKSSRLQSADAFVAEARRVARLKHPGIVQVYDVGRQDETCFIISEYVEGGSLADHLSKNPPTQQQAIRWVIEIADALDYAHLHGVIHRDIKPANILIDHHGRALLADFGIAQSANKAGRESLSLGTLRYMSPEQLNGRDVDLRSDIFSLGIVLHEVVAGRLPYSSPDPNVLRREIAAGLKAPLDRLLPGGVNRVCEKALQKDPHLRHVTAEQFAAELRRLLTTSPSSAGGSILGAVFVGLVMLVGMRLIFFYVLPVQKPTPQTDISPQPQAINLECDSSLLEFDGQSRIVTSLRSFAPSTLEAWIRKTEDVREQFVIGSDVPHNYGIGIGVNNNKPIVEVIRGGFNDDIPIAPGRWNHIAAVYGPDHTTLFINGKKRFVGAATLPPDLETPFIIGNVGKDHAVMFFRGQVRCLRISQGERYKTDFDPEPTFLPDDANSPHRAMLIFDGSKVENDRVTDLSGNGHDGVWERQRSP